jgi:hypothetical protein
MRNHLLAPRGGVMLAALLVLGAAVPSARGDFFVANFSGGTVSEVTSGGIVSTFASGFNSPRGLAFGTQGDLFVANFSDNTVSEVTPGGAVSTFASGFNGPVGLAFNAQGDLFVTNFRDNSVSEVTPGGIVSTFASGFNGPTALALSPAPEPASLGLLGVGLASLTGYGWGRRRRATIRPPAAENGR